MIEMLTQFGLSKKEAETYVSCLRAGRATANRISEAMGVPRSTVYDILERLRALGLVTTSVIGSKTNFVASDPEVLVEILEEKKQMVSKALPGLRSIHNKMAERPIAEIFQGKIAAGRLFDEIIERAESEVCIIGSQKNAVEKIGYRTDRFRQRRKEKGLLIRQILEESVPARSEEKNRYTKVRYLKRLSRSKEAIFILENYVYHIILQHEISAIRIKSADHAYSTKLIFEALWEKARR